MTSINDSYVIGYQPVTTNQGIFDPISLCYSATNTVLTPWRAVISSPIEAGVYELECIYKAETFSTLDSLLQFNNYMTNSGVEFSKNAVSYNAAASYFCSQVSQSCSNGEDYCSAFYDTTSMGDFCRASEINQPYSYRGNSLFIPALSAMDSAKISICSRFDLDECQCIRKTVDSNYITLNNYFSGDPYMNGDCWYLPCLTGGGLHLSTDYSNGTVCYPPDTTCSLLMEGIDYFFSTSSILNNGIYQTIFCLTGSSVTSSKEIRVDSSADSREIETTTTTPVYLWVLLGIAVLIFLIGILYFLFSRKQMNIK